MLLDAARFMGTAFIVKGLLAAGADPDAQDGFGQTPLHLAGARGRTRPGGGAALLAIVSVLKSYDA